MADTSLFIDLQLPKAGIEALRSVALNTDTKWRKFCFGTLAFGWLVLIVALVVAGAGVGKQTLPEIAVNYTNPMQLTDEGVDPFTPLYVLGGIVETAFYLYVLKQISRKNDHFAASMGIDRGWFSGGLFLLMQAGVIVALIEYSILSVVVISSVNWFIMTAVYITICRSRNVPIDDGVQPWPQFIGVDIPQSIYCVASAFYAFWSYFALGVFNKDPNFATLGQDGWGAFVCAAYFLGFSLFFAIILGDPLFPIFSAVGLFYLGTNAQMPDPITMQAMFPHTFISAYVSGGVCALLGIYTLYHLLCDEESHLARVKKMK